jgi:hypothetical protein
VAKFPLIWDFLLGIPATAPLPSPATTIQVVVPPPPAMFALIVAAPSIPSWDRSRSGLVDVTVYGQVTFIPWNPRLYRRVVSYPFYSRRDFPPICQWPKEVNRCLVESVCG